MRLLIVTQKVDSEDPVLGFFVSWIEEFAKHFGHTEVICLKEGKHNFYSAKNAVPRSENSEEFSATGVRVHSLGKERGAASRTAYVWRFLSLAWQLRKEYDAVFVHMNQEYVLIAGWLWKLLGKPVYLWRNHYAGSLATDVAAAFCTNVFCTSKHSYTTKYAKTVLMPVGVDTERFFPDARVARTPHSILFLARMSPSKRPEMLIDALALLARDNLEFTATFVGSPLPRDAAYYEGLKERVRSLSLADRIVFLSGVANSQTPDLYRAHEIFVNTSPSGMLDKTIFEAAASGCRVLAASEDFALLVPGSHFDSAASLSERLTSALKNPSSANLATIVKENSLTTLAEKLIDVITPRRLVVGGV